MTKKFLSLAILALCLILPAPSPAQQEELYSVIGPESDETYRVLCVDRQAPYLFRGEDGQLRGVYADLLGQVAAAARVRFILSIQAPGETSLSVFAIRPDIVLGSIYPADAARGSFGSMIVRNFDPMSADMESAMADNLVAISESERGRLCLSLPFLWESSTIFSGVRSDYSLNDLAGKRVCVLPNSYEEHLLERHGLVRDIVRASSLDRGMELVLSGECDAFLAETFQGRWLLARSPRYRYRIMGGNPPAQSYERGLVVLHGNTRLAAAVGRALYELKVSGRYNSILSSWLSGYGEFVPPPMLLFKILCVAGAVIGLILFWNHELSRKISIAASERERILDFVRDGILAVDKSGNITMLNRMAKLLLGLHDSDVGKNADELIPSLDIQTVIDLSRPVYNLEQNLRGALVSCNKVPVNVGGAPCGALVTLRDLSELYSMAEEMTGVKLYVESLRIRNHEFMNTLQAISGLVQLRQYDKALQYIALETDSNESAQSFMTERIKSAAVCGVLMGKSGVCREQHINFVLDPDSRCADHSGEVSDRSLVLIVGNLLQNAIEAHMEKGVRDGAEIRFSIFDESGYIFLSVRDTAGAMTPEIAPRLFEKGFSTRKKKRPSGLGLYSVRTIVESLGGDITVDYTPGEYTDFTVSIPVSQNQEVQTHA